VTAQQFENLLQRSFRHPVLLQRSFRHPVLPDEFV
jgi:hypothetical protein